MSKKILYIIPRFTTGGAEKLVFDYAEYFQKQGWKVAVASMVGGGELTEDFRDLGVEVIVGREKSLLNLYRNYQKLKETVEKFQSDIIHTHIFSSDFVGCLLKRKFRAVKWISTQHNVGREHSGWRRLVLRWILKKADTVIAVSEAVKNFCLDDLKLQEEKVRLIENGIALNQFLSITSDNLFVEDRLRIVVIGRLEEQKGHKFLFEALAKLKNIPWQLDIFGAGSLESRLKDLADKLKIAEKIVWRGVNKNVVQNMPNIDIIIQPSLWEGMSLVVMEAMAAGRLVIATHEAAEELLENKKTGLAVPARNPEALAKAISWAFKQRQEAKAIALAGREYARHSFGIERNIDGVIAVYKFLLSNSPNV